MSNNRDLFTFLQQNVMSHLAKNVKGLLAKQYRQITDPVFPSVLETLEVLKEYCRENDIPFGKPTVARSLTPEAVPIPSKEPEVDTFELTCKRTSISTSSTDKVDEKDSFTKAESDETGKNSPILANLPTLDRLIAERLEKTITSSHKEDEKILLEKDSSEPNDQEGSISTVKAIYLAYLRHAEEKPNQEAPSFEIGSSQEKMECSSVGKSFSETPAQRPDYRLFRPGGYKISRLSFSLKTRNSKKPFISPQ